MIVPMRDLPGTSLAELEQILAQREDQLPPFTWSMAPVILPIALIAAAAFLAAFGGKARFPLIYPWVQFWGNRNVALFIGALIAMFVLARQKGYSVAKICELSGMTEKETLKSWTVVATAVSVTGLLATLIGAAIFPFAPK